MTWAEFGACRTGVWDKYINKTNPRTGWACGGRGGRRLAACGPVGAGGTPAVHVGLLHDELADDGLLFAGDADEVGALGVAREVKGDCLIA